MDNQLFRDIQTDLDLNGPILSFTTQPADTTINVGQTATFTAVATVSFPGDPTPINSGTIGYQWYGPNGILTEGTKYVGTKTTTLQVTNVTSPADVGAYYVVVDYVPSSETGNAINEPFRSDNGNLIAPPLIEIIAQPTPVTTIPSTDNNFNINATLTDNGTDIGFQWQLDGENVSDGTITKSTVQQVPGTTQRRVTEYAPVGGHNATTIPAGATDVLFEIAGAAGGAGGGNFGPNPRGPNRVGGRGGRGMTGWFHLADSFYTDSNPLLGLKESVYVSLTAGRRGNDGVVGSRDGALGGTTPANRGNGGNGGAHGYGWDTGSSTGDAGGGGGGGAASYIFIKDRNAITAGGGGGGGGAFNNNNWDNKTVGNGENGMDAGPVRMSTMNDKYNPPVVQWEGGTTNVPITPGEGGVPGHNGQGTDTPGGGGGGAGWDGGQGGHHGHRPGGSPGGQQGSSGYDPLYVYYRSGSSNPNGDGWAGVHYTIDGAPTTNIVNVTRTTTISGSATNQLTLNTDGPGIGYTVRCSVNSSIASNSPVISDEVDYHVESTVTEANLTVEGIGLDSTVANISTTNLANGELTLDTIGTGFVGPAPTIQLYSLYAPDRDLDIEMDLYGGGLDSGTPEPGTGDTGGNDGGEGGFARIRFTMKQNEEYVIAGLTNNVNTPFLYRKASLMACVGEGGKAYKPNKGGDGGGIGISGQEGSGGGRTVPGGHAEPADGLGLSGSFGGAYGVAASSVGEIVSNGPSPGRTIKCTKGVWWAQEGLSPCQDITDPVLSHFRLPDGREAANTGLINRGYKSGLNYIQTAGGGSTGLRGGNGATGGTGAIPETQAAGGGSGYGDGSFNIITTTQGGSREAAKVVIRVVT